MSASAQATGAASVKTGAPAWRAAIEAQLRSETAILLKGKGVEEGAELGELTSDLIVVTLLKRAGQVLTWVEALGWTEATGADGTTYGSKELIDPYEDRFLGACFAFMAAIEERAKTTWDGEALLRAVAAAIEDVALLWLEGMQTPPDGQYRVHWVASAAWKIHAMQGLRRMDVTTLDGAMLREEVAKMGHSIEEQPNVTLCDLRDAEGAELAAVAGAFHMILQLRQAELEAQWKGTWHVTTSVLAYLVLRGRAGPDDATTTAELLELLRSTFLPALGLEEAKGGDDRVFRVEDLQADAADLADAINAWRSVVEPYREMNSPGQMAWAVLGWAERSLTEATFGEIVAQLTSAPETCDEEWIATERRTEEIPRAADAATPPSALREEFAAKVAAARIAVDAVACELQEQIRRTVGAPLKSREAEEELIAAVDDALKLGIVITVDGREATKLFFQDEILTWRLARGGGRGFRKHAAHTTVSAPAGIPNPVPHPDL